MALHIRKIVLEVVSQMDVGQGKGLEGWTRDEAVDQFRKLGRAGTGWEH